MSLLRVNGAVRSEESPKIHLQSYNPGIFRSFVAQNDIIA
jgi:hypothetical protein